MRHRKNKLLQIRGSVQKRDLVMRTMLTNLVKNGYITTTQKKAKVLIAYTNSFFSKLSSFSSFESSDANREIIRLVKSVVFWNDEWKKIVFEMLPFFISKEFSTSFLTHIKLGKRLGDGAELIKIEFLK